jgi:hypothetical protein
MVKIRNEKYVYLYIQLFVLLFQDNKAIPVGFILRTLFSQRRTLAIVDFELLATV